MQHQIKSFTLGLIALLLIVVGAACSSADASAPAAPAQEQSEIKIGYMGPRTGGAAFIGQEQLGFIEAAVDLFNEESGLNIEIVEADTVLDADEGKIVAERLAADADILAVVGPAGSQVCEATQPVFADAGLMHITPSCTRTDLTQPGTATFFRPIPHDDVQGPTIAGYLAEAIGINSAYIVDDQSSYAAGLVNEFEANLSELGVQEIEIASITQEDTDLSSLATTIIAAEPDAIFFPGQIASQMGSLIAQLRAQGYDGVYFLGDGGFDLSWVDIAGEAAENAYVSFFAPDPRFIPQAEPYTQHYTAQYEEEYGAFGGPAALSAQIVLEAIERCHSAGTLTRACVIDQTAATDMADSLLGIPVSFGTGNQLDGGAFFIFQVQNGEFVLVK